MPNGGLVCFGNAEKLLLKGVLLKGKRGQREKGEQRVLFQHINSLFSFFSLSSFNQYKCLSLLARNRVKMVVRRPRMAAKNAPQTQINAFENAPLLNGIYHILRASRRITALARTQKWRDKQPINANRQQDDLLGDLIQKTKHGGNFADFLLKFCG